MRVQHEEPQAATIVGVGLAMTSVCLFSSFLTQLWSATYSWRPQPLATWLVTMVYLDSFLYIVIASVLKFGLANTVMTASRCKSTDIVCLTVYLSTKLLIYFFLVEKACIINGRSKPRLDSKSWLLNIMGILACYILILVFEFLHRSTTVESGVCIVNGKLEALIGIILWDIGAKVYLASLFLKPIWNRFFLRRSAPNYTIRRTTIRFLVGLACLLAAAIVNASVLSTIHGEPMWICMLSCTCDILYASAVIHWITLQDQTEVTPPPLVISNVEYAVDNSHPSARSRRNTMSAQSPPEWLRPHHLQAQVSGQSLIGMLSDDDDKELRFAHHRSLLEIERRSSKGGPTGAGRAMGGGGLTLRSAAEDAIDCEKAEAMVAAWNATSESSGSSSRAAERGGHVDKGKRPAVAVNGLEDTDRSSASDTSSLSRPVRDDTSKAWGKRAETQGSVRRALQHVKDGVRSRNEGAEKQPPGL
ncbi:hypothetical protein FJTKL_03315 [Diaporthe vaccinii]|uniref:Integral membrane protein n=1 Tax=Diaporthe vaccinii TaxID=105482 RepID=A0ABR4DVB9_9PEZI